MPGCKNYDSEEGDKWTEEDFPALLPHLQKARGFTDGAPPQYQQRETTHGTARCFADLGVQISHHIHERYDFKGPWDSYGKESTESRHKAVRNRTAVINNAYLHAKHNAKAMARPTQVNERAGGGQPSSYSFSANLSHSSPFNILAPLPMQEKSEARWRDYAADHYYHYYYWYGEDETGKPLTEAHRNDDLLELAAVSRIGLEP